MNPYLRTKILTASPEELRLMLIEGALKFTRQAVDALGRQDFEAMFEGTQRAKAIALELSTSMNRDVNPELCDRVSALYIYIYRRLSDGCLNRQNEEFNEAIELLEFEKETWELALKKLQDEKSNPEAAAGPGLENKSAPIASIGQSPTQPTNKPAYPPAKAPNAPGTYAPPKAPARPSKSLSIQG